MPDFDVLWTDATLVAAGGQVQSGWIRVAGNEFLAISRNQAGGTYAFEIDWSRDEGATIDYTESVATTEDDVVRQDVAMPWARFRVRNTGAAAFTAHRTTVSAWG